MALSLAAVTLLGYFPVGEHPFILLDDDIYVTDNPQVRSGLSAASAVWAFTTFHASNWHPLTWLSHMMDVSLFGMDPEWHHRTNIFFHLLNTELLFFLLWRMTGGLWQSAFAAALFGIHPLHVESVVWVSERKDVLSTLFFLLAVGAYSRYVRRPTVGRYVRVAILFGLGLMSKPMLVTLPFVLLLLDYWPLNRLSPFSLDAFTRLIKEKIPLVVMSTGSCIVTYLAQQAGGAISSLETLPFRARAANAAMSYTLYLGKTVWPGSLSVFYPFSNDGIPVWQIAGAILILAGLSLLALWHWKSRPWLTVGWLWYIGTLVPVIGLVQVGAQAMADRYTYLPLIGIFLAIAWGLSDAFGRWHFRRMVLGFLAAVIVIISSGLSWIQAGYWKNDITLFTHAIKVTENNWKAWKHLGYAYYKLGQYPQAVDAFRQSIEYAPDNDESWNKLGLAYLRLGQLQMATDAFQKSLELRQDFPETWYNLGVVYGALGRYQQAMNTFQEALRLKPDHVEAWYGLGNSLACQGQDPQAIEAFREVLRLNPNHSMALYGLGMAHAALGQRQETFQAYQILRHLNLALAEELAKKAGLPK